MLRRRKKAKDLIPGDMIILDTGYREREAEVPVKVLTIENVKGLFDQSEIKITVDADFVPANLQPDVLVALDVMEEQHHRPCGTCPFTGRVDPGHLGGSPPEVYVAQHFLPYLVICHEFIDYDDEEWAEAASNRGDHQCVGFAMCRNRSGVADAMPGALLDVEHDAKTDSFADIWEFWSHHNGVTYAAAVETLSPGVIVEMCRKELERQGGTFHNLNNDAQQTRKNANHEILVRVRPLILLAWFAASRKVVRAAIDHAIKKENEHE